MRRRRVKAERRQARAAAQPTAWTTAELVEGATTVDPYRLRLARPGDWPGIAQLVPMAGVPIEDELRVAIEEGLAGDVARQALVSEEAGLTAMAGHLRSGLLTMMMASTFALVATHPDLDQPVGVCVVNPPGQVVGQISAAGASRQQLMLVMMGVAKIPALAVDQEHRGGGLGQALARGAAGLAHQVGAVYVYGQIRLEDGLDDWYRRAGFTVLPPTASIDLSWLVDQRMTISSMPGEQLFLSDQAPTRPR